MKKILLFGFIFLGFCHMQAQETFTRNDSLHGGLRFERTCYDVLHYGLKVKVDIEKRYLSGFNDIQFKIVQKTNRIQLDLFENMQIDSIVYENRHLNYTREFNAVFVEFPQMLLENEQKQLRFYYSGNPLVAKNAPWDGGFVFNKDSNGKPWVGVAVQGTGASLWYPVKDSQTDEPDHGATIQVAAPNGLMDVSNGKFTGSQDLKNGYTLWNWEVKSPINSYDITLNIADYAHFGERYKGLDLDYYVLKENEAKARKQFEQVKPMLDCFESKFGTYPFFQDGYKLVETPYLGMEHQSAVAYGNKYRNGYLGNDLSGTGKGLLFDFIIVHESGHEWFGNSITSKDIADMWIHEGFTCYTESVYLECLYGPETAQAYINGLKKNIDNDKPVIGQYGVQNEGSGDMYYKGALMLNTIRSIVNDDQKWWKLLLGYSNAFRHKIIDTETVVTFFNQETGRNLTPVFNQYLRHKNIPVLELRIEKNKAQYRWNAEEPGFDMPIDVKCKGEVHRLQPQSQWKNADSRIKNWNEIEIQTEKFLVRVSRI